MKGFGILLIMLCATSSIFGQTDNSTVNLTELETQENFYVQNKYSIDKDGLHLFYTLIYDDKNSWDDEILRTVYIQIPSPSLTKYSLEDLLKYYSEQGALHYNKETQNLSGTITIIELNESRITANLNVEFELNETIFTCIGLKEFRKE